MEIFALKFCGAFFLFISAIHIARFLFPKLSVKLGFNEPLWYSILALVVPLILGIWILNI